MPASSAAQQRFFGLVRAVQKGDVSLDSVDAGVQRAAKRMVPKDVRDFAQTKRKDLPERKENEVPKQALCMDLLGAAWLMHKSADAQQLSKSVANVQKSIQQLGVNRRKQLEKDLKTVHGHLQKAQKGHTDMESKIRAHETGLEDRKTEMESAANEKRLQMELDAEERRHQQRTRHEQEKTKMDMEKSIQQTQVEAQMQQKQMEALNGPPGVQAPSGQVPFGDQATIQQEERKGGKPKR